MRTFHDALRRREAPRIKGAFWERDRPLFMPRASLKPLMVVVDADLLTQVNDCPNRLYLLELLADKSINRYFYANDGPPPSLRRISDGTNQFVPDWVIAEWDREHRTSGVQYISRDANGKHRYHDTLISKGNFLNNASSWSIPSAYGSRVQGRARILDDVKLALVADSIMADILVCDRAGLFLADNSRLFNKIAICSPEQALSLVGLYLREQGVYRLSSSSSLSRSMLFAMLTEELLTEHENWLAACAEFLQRTGQHQVENDAISVLGRINRALRLRDKFYSQFFLPQTVETIEEALFSVDSILIQLMAALDASAVTTHALLGLDEGQSHQAGWKTTNKAWRKSLAAHHPEMASKVTGFDNATGLLGVLPRLRNSIHSQANQMIAHRGQENHTSPIDVKLLVVKDAADLNSSLPRETGESWGLLREYSAPAEHLIFDPTRVVEHSIRLTIDFLNMVMRQIAVASQPATGVSANHSGSSNSHQFLTPLHASRILWQFGLE